MNHLRITNNGLICAEDLMLIGSSTKREQTDKIGMFGSGWKYALAWLLRNDCKPTIFSGTDKIEIDYNMKMHRANAVKVITVNGQETSLTTEMGPKWTGWMALREVLSNAIDEGGHSIQTAWNPVLEGISGQTVIYIPMDSELSEVMMKYDSYFAFNRKENYNLDGHRIFIKKEPSPINIYRKGIRCFDSQQPTNIDFDFLDININEDRLCSEYSINIAISDILKKNTNPTILKLILEEGRESWTPWTMNSNIRECLISLINEGITLTTHTIRKLGGMLFSDPNALIIRADWFKELQDLGLVKSPFEMFSGDVQFVRTDAKKTEGIKFWLKGFHVNIEIRSGKCIPVAFFKNGIGYIQDSSNLTDKQLAAELLHCIDRDYWLQQMD